MGSGTQQSTTSASITQNNTYNIVVNVKDGEMARDVGQQVEEMLKNREDDSLARLRSSHYDEGDIF